MIGLTINSNYLIMIIIIYHQVRLTHNLYEFSTTSLV